MSDALPADVVTTLFVGGVANRPMRFWAYESVPLLAEFRQGSARGPLIDVTGASIALLPPDGSPDIAPADFVIRTGVGRYLAYIAPSLVGPWQAVVRCIGPTASVDVKGFFIDALPAGTPPRAQTFITDDSGLYLRLTPAGLLIAA
ncbi:hypothetical protein [Roseomonas indoligenes]|uniref:Uncharacterized protein n=1 Tax=Roseomonas indoligenes TaxID=2820811 RepID=A0A940MRF0_9PROT|nr:hypothetical protein [Pararoseomonas indoligenes]MBP0492094.1 hypothetical protein [Pararoseomonas indoligenes]